MTASANWKTYMTTANTVPYSVVRSAATKTEKTSRPIMNNQTTPKLAASRSESFTFQRIRARRCPPTRAASSLCTTSTCRSCSSLSPRLKRVVRRPVSA